MWCIDQEEMVENNDDDDDIFGRPTCSTHP